MSINVTVTTLCGKTLEVAVAQNTTVSALRAQIEETSRVRCTGHRLVCAGRQLRDSEQLAHCAAAGAVLFLVPEQCGGKKKKKKKEYSTPKKVKEAKPRERFLFKRLFDIGGDGEFVPRSEECPRCGPLHFLSKEHGRMFCPQCFFGIESEPALPQVQILAKQPLAHDSQA